MSARLRCPPALALLATVAAYAGDAKPPPASPTRAAATALHGITVNDPYRWLENPQDPAVQAWIKAQNEHTEAVLAAMPAGNAMTERVQQLAITSTTRSSPRLAGGTLFYMQETPPERRTPYIRPC